MKRAGGVELVMMAGHVRTVARSAEYSNLDFAACNAAIVLIKAQASGYR